MSAPFPSYADEIEAEYREGGEYRCDDATPAKLLVCRMCERIVQDTDTIGEAVCCECAKLHGLIACDGCGRVLAVGAAKRHSEVGELSGRLITYDYCPACERDWLRLSSLG